MLTLDIRNFTFSVSLQVNLDAYSNGSIILIQVPKTVVISDFHKFINVKKSAVKLIL